MVVQPPTITSQPQSRALLAGQSVTFNVTAASTDPVSYQWQFNGGDIPGATDPGFSLLAIKDADAGSYCVVVTNNLGGVGREYGL